MLDSSVRRSGWWCVPVFPLHGKLLLLTRSSDTASSPSGLSSELLPGTHPPHPSRSHVSSVLDNRHHCSIVMSPVAVPSASHQEPRGHCPVLLLVPSTGTHTEHVCARETYREQMKHFPAGMRTVWMAVVNGAFASRRAWRDKSDQDLA